MRHTQRLLLCLERSLYLPIAIRRAGMWPVLRCSIGSNGCRLWGRSGGGDDPSTLETGRVNVPGRGGPHGPGVTETEIRLGMTNDLTGSGDTPYAVITTAMQAYFAKVSTEDGGVCERKLVLLAEDDRYTPEGALERTKKLVEQDGVLAMIGGLGTAVHQPVAAYLNDPNADGNHSDGVPDLFVSTGWSGWGDVAKYPWTIDYIPAYVTDGRVLARYINNNLGGKKIAILHQNDEFGGDTLIGINETIADKGLIVWTQARRSISRYSEIAGAPDA